MNPASRTALITALMMVFDRVRIERLVWTLDQRLYDLPRTSRIAKRREVRANLIEATADRGVGEALRRVVRSPG